MFLSFILFSLHCSNKILIVLQFRKKDFIMTISSTINAFKILLSLISKSIKDDSSTNLLNFTEDSCQKGSSIIDEKNLVQPQTLNNTLSNNDETITFGRSKDFSYEQYREMFRSKCRLTINGESKINEVQISPILMEVNVKTNSPASEKIKMITEAITKNEAEIIKLVSVKIDDANQILTYEVKPIESVVEGELDEEEIKIPYSIPSESIFSYTKVSLFEKCPKAFEFKYVLKTPELFSSVEKHLGKSVHSAIFNAYKEISAGNIISLDFLIDAYSKEWHSIEKENIRVIKKDTFLEDYYLYGKNMLRNFYQRIISIDESKTIELEKEFLINLNDKIYYRGYIDRISKKPNGKLRLIDFKTGKRVKRPISDMQLCSYAIWAFKEYKEDEIEIVFEALKHEKTMISRIKRSQIPAIREKLLISIDKIIATKLFIANPSILCDWCGFNELCDDDDPIKCPWCGGDLEERDGRFGLFIGCVEYPECRYSRENW